MAKPFSIFKDPQKGIADSPHLGIADMRCVNILSMPGSAMVNFKTAAMNKPATVSGLAYTTDVTANTLTVNSTSGWYNGMAVTLDTVVTSTGISTGRVYWIGDLTATTVKLYKNPSREITSLVDITGSNGSGTLSSYTITAPLDKAQFFIAGGAVIRNYNFILDDSGRVWWIDNTGGTVTSNLIYLGNDTLTGTVGRAIAVYEQHLIVFRSSTTDYLPISAIEAGIDLDTSNGWVYGWESVGNVPQNPRPTLVSDGLYFGNDGKVGSIVENAGSNFAPSSGATYTKTSNARSVPVGDDVNALGELGSLMLIGGVRDKIYPWDFASPSFFDPLTVPEHKVVKIVSSGQVAYILAGNRGRIYVTNGATVEPFKKIPDYVADAVDPYFNWGDIQPWKGQLYLSFSASKNDGTALNTTGGLWAIDLTTQALRHVLKLSYDTYGGTAPVILPNTLTDTPPGIGLYVGWSHSGTYGVDASSSNPYTNYETRIDTAIYPVGEILKEFTPDRFLYRLTKKLITGEGVKLYWRKNLSDSFDEFKETTLAGLLSDFANSEFTNAEWVQLRIELKSTATNPSYVPLNEVYLT